jgi:hypothetical protein
VLTKFSSVLNCRSFDSTLDSLEVILGLPQEIIRNAISAFDCNQFSKEHPHDYRKLGEILLDLLVQRGGAIQPPKQIHWFHGTRVLRPESLGSGLNPLSEQMETIWRDLFELGRRWVGQDQWNVFRREVEMNGMVRHRLTFKEDHGPHAVLIRDALIMPNRFGGVDYLRCPEIVENICDSFGQSFGKNLLQLFCDSSYPCIVTFRDDQPRADVIGAATSYIWCIARGEDCVLCNTCFEANGRSVDDTAIVHIEVLG